MTDKQRRFCDEYLIDLNATRAYKAAYPLIKGDEAAAAAGARLLRNVKVAEYIQNAMSQRQQRTEITADRVLEEIARLAFFDPRKLFDVKGRPVPIEDLDDDTAACISGLDIMELPAGALVKKYKLTDKRGALELLGRHLGLFTDKLQLSGEVQINDARALLLERLNQKRK